MRRSIPLDLPLDTGNPGYYEQASPGHADVNVQYVVVADVAGFLTSSVFTVSVTSIPPLSSSAQALLFETKPLPGSSLAGSDFESGACGVLYTTW